jgi:hypothetical protein
MIRFQIPLVLSGDAFLGVSLRAVPDWDALPKTDGGNALDVLRSHLKLSYVEWETTSASLEGCYLDASESTSETETPSKPPTGADSGEKHPPVPVPGSWQPVPNFAKPFPWDGQELVPCALMVGWTVRPVGCFTDIEEGRTLGIPKCFGPKVTLSWSPKLKTVIHRILEQNRFGFHCSDTGTSSRYAAFLTITEVTQEHRGVFMSIKRVPDNDDEPMEEVERGWLPATLPGCAMCAKDEVGLRLQFSVDPHRDGTGVMKQFDVCAKDRGARDLIATAIWALQSQCIPSLPEEGSATAIRPLLTRVRMEVEAPTQSS